MLSGSHGGKKPVVATSTAEVVKILHFLALNLDHQPSDSRGKLEFAYEILSKTLKNAGSGWRLQMIQRVAPSDRRIDGAPFVRVLEYGQEFESSSRVLEKELPVNCGDAGLHMKSSVVLLGSFGTFRSGVDSSTIAEPNQMLEQMEAIVAASASVDDSQISGFLDKLQEGCLRAKRAGHLYACVEIKDVVEGGNASLVFESFSVPTAKDIELERGRRSGVGEVMSIQVLQQDLPV